MLALLKNESNTTHTENGAAAYRSTQSDCLDLFATIGALRGESDGEILTRFFHAYAEDADLAMKILFFARDVRGGIGERRVFRTILRELARRAPQSVEKNLGHIAEYGRYDDLLVLLGTPCESMVLRHIAGQLAADQAALREGRPISLLSKWLPSVNASNPQTVRQAKHIARALGMQDAQYRRTLSALRARLHLIENNLRQRDYTFDYSAQPSQAMFKYRNAFLRNDRERYSAFMARAAEGAEKLHTGTLTPYEIIRPFFQDSPVSAREREAINATWKAQEDFAGGGSTLVVADGSGSMYWEDKALPATVALSLGIYYAERSTGPFRNHFVTFSEKPRLIEIKGRDIYEKIQYCRTFNEAANTNLQKVFELILRTALKHHVSKEEIPARLCIISDMEFDACAEGSSLTNFEYARELFARNGYQLPEVVFWNVSSRNRQQPVTKNEQGVVLVSGSSPRVFSMLQKDLLSPWAFMMDVLGSDRYAAISA